MRRKSHKSPLPAHRQPLYKYESSTSILVAQAWFHDTLVDADVAIIVEIILYHSINDLVLVIYRSTV